ncbi:MAG: right-handed parallel beta-helix repeat-containing protein [Rikenellaceae bacterium]
MKLKTLIALFTAITLLFSCSSTDSSKAEKNFIISLSDSDDATLKVLKTIQEIEKNGGNSTITFEKGTYHFYPEFAFEKYQFYTNHGDYLTRYGFFLSGLKNVTIDGGGSEFIFHGVMAPFVVEHSDNVEIKNFSIDYKYPFYSEGKIVATNANNNTFDMEISDDFTYEIRDEQLFFLTPYYEFPIGQNYAYDPETRAVAYNASNIPDQSGSGQKLDEDNQYKEHYGFDYKYGIDPFDWSIRQRGTRMLYKVKELKKGVVRVTATAGAKLPQVGWVMVMKGRQGYNRLFSGFKFESVKDLYLENITLYHAAGMGYLFENCENTDMYKCKLIPSEGRLISATADATHYSGCRGTLSMRDCVMQSQLDDGTNIHGAYQAIEEAFDDHSVVIRAIHHQQFGFVLGRSGDKIAVVDPKQKLKQLYELTLESSELLNSRYQILTFKEELPKDLKKNLLLENLTAQPTVLIENSNFSRNRARALLISTPAGTVIRNNYFSVEMSGVIVSGSGYEYYWAESGYAKDVVIEGNTFENCCVGKKPAPSIMVHNGDNFDKMQMENITIKNNIFKQSENYILQLQGVKGVNFEGNTIINNHKYPQQFASSPVITVENSMDIKFSNNKNGGVAPKVVEYLDDSAQVEFN